MHHSTNYFSTSSKGFYVSRYHVAFLYMELEDTLRTYYTSAKDDKNSVSQIMLKSLQCISTSANFSGITKSGSGHGCFRQPQNILRQTTTKVSLNDKVCLLYEPTLSSLLQ